MITRLNSRILTRSPYIWISPIFWKWPFRWWLFTWKILIKGEFVKIQKFILVMIFVIFNQKWQFRLKTENFWKFSEFSPIMSHIFNSSVRSSMSSGTINIFWINLAVIELSVDSSTELKTSKIFKIKKIKSGDCQE